MWTILWAVLTPIAVIGAKTETARRAEQLQDGTSALDTALIRAAAQFLSHDSLLGRATGSSGAMLAAQYISSMCSEIGLTPVADDFLGDVPLARAKLLPQETSLTIRGRFNEISFAAPESFLPTGATTGTLTSFRGPAVFVGSISDIIPASYGDKVRGKVAVTADPMTSAAAGQKLRDNGAVGVINLVRDRDMRSYVEWLRGEDPLHFTEAVESSFFPNIPTVAAWPELGRAIMALADVPTESSLPIDLNLLVHVQIRFDSSSVDAHNVVCLLQGRDAGARDSAVALTAHYDHLGIWTPDETGDSVYNGFSDNAAGVAMLLAIAEAMVRTDSRPRHSFLFVFFTGEENGLLGSDHFAAKPSWPLEQLLGVINVDAGAPPAPPRSWRIAGGDNSQLGILAAEVAAANGWRVTTSMATPNSDYFPFWRRGVPAIFLIPGEGPYEGLSADSSRSLRQHWNRYHQPGDEWSDEFDLAGMERYAEFAYRVADALDRRGLRSGGQSDGEALRDPGGRE